MDQSEELEEGETLPQTENQSKAKSKQSDDEVEPESWETESKVDIIDFKSNQPSSSKRAQPSLSSCSSGQLSEKDQPPSPKRVKQSSEVPSGQSPQQHQTELDSIFKELKKKTFTFEESENKQQMKKSREVFKETTLQLESEVEKFYPERIGVHSTTVDLVEDNDPPKSPMSKLAVEEFLTMLEQNYLDDLLQSKSFTTCQQTLKSNMKKKFQSVFEGIAKSGNQSFLNEIYTELYITEGGSEEVNGEHEVRQIETVSWKPDQPETAIRYGDIFKPSPEREEPIKTVMTTGVAGIGKTVLTQKFTLDWAEDKINQNIHFMFPFTFRELNLLKDKQFSLVKLVHHFFSETKGILIFEELKVVFIFDGLDECRLPLDFHNNEILMDVRKSTSVDVLLTNLISGNLLPKAHLWITTRPAAANKIPPEFIGMRTEIRGFTDLQKDNYFTKRFRYKKQASMVISHIKKSRTLHIMCHIPIFCWITATVVEDMLNKKDGEELPKTLTEMYIHFLVVQVKLKAIKYDGGAETDSHWSPENQKMIESLGKLAFDQLMKRNLIFYESDLAECGIDIRAASVCSGVFTQIFREENGLYQNKLFCFVHLSVQEFLAALHVQLTFIKSGVNLLVKGEIKSKDLEKQNHASSETEMYKSAVDMALESPDGHLDLFLRFLLGLSLETNKHRLRGLVRRTEESLAINKDTAQYIKEKLNHHAVEKSINLFHCLSELNDQSLVEEIQQSLNTGSLSAHQLSPAQWSALHYILLTSDKDLEVFDLKKYCASEEALQRLLPIVNASSKAILSGCNLSEKSCEALSSFISSTTSSLKDLDLSNNDLTDSGVKLLCEGLMSPNCKLEILRLSGCLITEEGCAALASGLTVNSSHLKELDLSYNNAGEAGMKSLEAILKNPSFKLDSLSMEPAGDKWMTAGLRKYSCPLTVDLNTVNRFLRLSDKNRKMTGVEEEQPYPDHPDRFDLHQLLCTDGLTGRCYWEVEWGGKVYISVSYRGINRKGENDGSWFGFNNNSWCLICSNDGYTIWHDSKNVFIPSSSSSPSGRVAVYVDCPAGTLSFYRVSSDTLIHLYTANTKFTEPLYPGFGVGIVPGSWCSF